MANQPSSSPSTHFDQLPDDLLLLIINRLDLQSISRLSRTSNYLFHFIRSDSIWRLISRNLVGPWIHRPKLISHQLGQLNDTYKLRNPPVPLDWTQDPNSFPLSHFIRSSSSPASFRRDEPVIQSWYHFATRFLIPHFHYLGWHISLDLPYFHPILVTYDISSGRLIAEDIKCYNLHNLPHNLLPPLSDQILIYNAISTSPLPSWLPLNQIHPTSNGYQYTLSPELSTIHQGFTFDVFTPVYHSSPFFSISPFPPHYTLLRQDTYVNSSQSSLELAVTSPISKFHSWEKFKFASYPLNSDYVSKMIARRSPVILRQVLNQDTDDFVGMPGVDDQQFHSFEFTGATSNQTFSFKPPDHNPRIRYQGAPPPQKIHVADVLLAGRIYNTTREGSLWPILVSPKFCIECYSIDGPSTLQSQSNENWFNGLWVGTYETFVHFGKIHIEKNHKLDGLIHLSFDQISDDFNATSRRFIWKVTIDEEHVRSVSLPDATNFDCGWILGVGKEERRSDRTVDIKVQLIKKRIIKQDQERVNLIKTNVLLDTIDQIRVQWIDRRLITSYFPVGFQI